MIKEELHGLAMRAVRDGTGLSLTESETRFLETVLAEGAGGDDGVGLRVQAMAMVIDAYRGTTSSATELVKEAEKIEAYLSGPKD